MDFKRITLASLLLVLVACQSKHDTQHYEKSLDDAIADTKQNLSRPIKPFLVSQNTILMPSRSMPLAFSPGS